jgi:uncharacterized membrane protein YedE/YeeE
LRRALARPLVALGSGLLFGTGLLLSGMTRPSKVLAFLDPLGTWDPSFALALAGAAAVYAVGLRWGSSRRAPLAAPLFSVRPGSRIDRHLLVGAAVFGIGLGIGGYCPGPSLVAVASGGLGVLAFVGFMLLGSLVAVSLETHAERPHAREDEVLQSRA